MKCPIDNETLVISERKNIEIDYCPSCRGVWLDRGELDKLIAAEPAYERPQSRPETSYSDDNQHRSNGNQHHKRKKESFLSDFFDM